MCIMTEEADVKKTNIFVAPDIDRNMQITIYSNNVQSQRDNLMILPVPNIESIQYINLESFPELFEDLDYNFSAINMSGEEMSGELLKVVDVGSYQATTVPDISQLNNIDRLYFGVIPSNIKAMLKKYYPTFGFIVCKLDSSNTLKKYHPFAYKHKILNNRLFIPTRHHHGGDSEEEGYSSWDHIIYSYNTYNEHNNHPRRTETSMPIDRTQKYINVLNFNFGPIVTYCKFSIKGHLINKDIEFRYLINRHVETNIDDSIINKENYIWN